MQIKNYRIVQNSSRIGVFDLVIPKWGNFVIRGVSHFQKGSSRWISMPSTAYEKEGKKKYFAHVGFEDQATYKKFEEKVLELLQSFVNLQTSGEPKPPMEQMEIPF